MPGNTKKIKMGRFCAVEAGERAGTETGPPEVLLPGLSNCHLSTNKVYAKIPPAALLTLPPRGPLRPNKGQ